MFVLFLMYLVALGLNFGSYWFIGWYFVARDARHAWQIWSVSDDVHSFEAHISIRHRDSSREAGGDGDGGAPLWIFVGPEDLPRLAGSAVRPEQSLRLFSRWRASVPPDRRCGTEQHPTVGIVVDGVSVPDSDF